jgi:hypothetical protein
VRVRVKRTVTISGQICAPVSTIIDVGRHCSQLIQLEAADSGGMSLSPQEDPGPWFAKGIVGSGREQKANETIDPRTRYWMGKGLCVGVRRWL